MSASILNIASRTRRFVAVPVVFTAFVAACSDDTTPTSPMVSTPAPLFTAQGNGGGNICGAKCGAPILFDRFVNGGATHYVGKMDSNGANVVLLHVGSNPRWSPNFKKIVFNLLGNFGAQEIWTMNADGSNAQQITNVAGGNDNPSFSPDGLRIVFVSYRTGSGQIFTMNADGTNQIQLTNVSSNDRPSWSPDGTKIAFTSYRNGNADVFVMSANGSNQQALTTDPEAEGYPKWSPDGKKIAYTRPNTACDIMVMNADGSGKTSIQNGLTDCEVPTWSPNGAKIALVSELIFGQSYAIYTMNADGTGLTKINLGRQMDLLPAWSRE